MFTCLRITLKLTLQGSATVGSDTGNGNGNESGKEKGGVEGEKDERGTRRIESEAVVRTTRGGFADVGFVVIIGVFEGLDVLGKGLLDELIKLMNDEEPSTCDY